MQKTGALEFPIYTSTVVLQNCSATATKEGAKQSKSKATQGLDFQRLFGHKTSIIEPQWVK
jgi:hypothetical protein